jgi:hypothetical protein
MTINDWLKNPSDYATGLTLFNQVKISTRHDAFLAGNHAPNSMQHKLLISLLTRASIKNPVTVPAPKATPPKIEIKPNPMVETRFIASDVEPKNLSSASDLIAPVRVIESSSLPPELQAIYAGIKEKYKSMSMTHALMVDPAGTDETRKDYLAKLIAADNEVRAAWNIIDDFVKNGKLPEAAPKPTALELSEKRSNLIRNIQRTVAQLKRDNLKPDTRTKFENKLSAFKTELKSIETSLNNV